MSEITKIADLVDPEVLADMISAKLDKKIRVIPFAKVDTTLMGIAGDEITVPRFVWEGEAVEVAEGEEIPLRELGTDTAKYKIKKAGIGSAITDEAILSGYGDAVGATGNGIVKSILAKVDNDAMAELAQASTIYDGAAEILSYENIVNAVDLFEEEENSEKAMFIHPKQVTQLRKDPDFVDKSHYGNDVMVTGEIGMVANTRMVVSKKVKLEYTYGATSDEALVSGKKYFTLSDGVYTEVETPDVDDIATYYEITATYYLNPIVKLETDPEVEDEIPALTYYLKRDTNIETERKSRTRKTEITGDQMYVVALTNDSKVVLARNKAE